MTNNLIIKSSYSKLPNGELKSNFGDLIRSTVLLNCIGDDFIWLTDSRSVGLLKWFVDCDKIVVFKDSLGNLTFSENLNIYNLDNYIANEKLFVQLKGKWHGYTKKNGVFGPGNELIEYTEPYRKIRNTKLEGFSWQQALVEGTGFSWEEQDFPKVKINGKEKFDVGLNWYVHPTWKSKHWPKKSWKKLETILKKSNSVSWQQGLNNFDKYILWLSSCKLIVTCDTLGLHLASALRKKVVAIVGPTENNEYSYGRIFFVRPQRLDCMPCNQPECKRSKNCLDTIPPNEVGKIVIQKLNS